jgi:hypothetical protein
MTHVDFSSPNLGWKAGGMKIAVLSVAVGAACVAGSGCAGSSLGTGGASSSSTTTSASQSASSSGSAGGGGSSNAPDWSCLGAAHWPKPQAEKAEFTVRLWRFSDPTSFHVLTGATVDACAKGDLACSSPLSTATDSLSAGRYSLSVPTGIRGFDGYLLVHEAGMLDAPAFTQPWVAHDTVWSVTLDSPTSLSGLAAAAGVTLDPSRGHAAINVGDCALAKGPPPASGAVVSVAQADARSTIVYLEDAAVWIDPSLHATGATGVAFAFNLPAGPVDAVARVASTQELIGQASFFVLPRVESTVGIVPADSGP